jgi:hypothetical protein
MLLKHELLCVNVLGAGASGRISLQSERCERMKRVMCRVTLLSIRWWNYFRTVHVEPESLETLSIFILGAATLLLLFSLIGAWMSLCPMYCRWVHGYRST